MKRRDGIVGLTALTMAVESEPPLLPGAVVLPAGVLLLVVVTVVVVKVVNVVFVMFSLLELASADIMESIATAITTSIDLPEDAMLHCK